VEYGICRTYVSRGKRAAEKREDLEMPFISVDEARQLSRAILVKTGMDNTEADIITNILLERR